MCIHLTIVLKHTKQKLRELQVKTEGGPKMVEEFLPHKFIKRSIERWANSTKQLLKTVRGHQASIKAAHSLLKEVGENIKDKKRDERAPDGDLSRGGSHEGEVSRHQKTSHQQVCGEFWNLRGQHNREKKTKQNPIDYMPNCNSQQRSSPDTRVHQQWVGAEPRHRLHA